MNKLYLLLLPLIVISCSSQKEVSKDQVVERKGITYEVNSEIPYTGRVIYKNENGLTVVRETYSEGVLQGPYEYYHDNGQLMSKGQFTEGNLDGETVDYHENGQLQLKSNYVNGKQEGYQESFFDNGEIRNKITYKNGILMGDYLNFYIGGILKEKRVYKEQPENYPKRYNGDYSFEEFDEDGQISRRGSYKKGELDGTYETFVGGKLLSKTSYKDGEEFGPFEMFYLNGNLRTRGFWGESGREGLYEEFHENGDPHLSVNYLQGKEHGTKKTYNNGFLEFEENFEEGKEHGWVIWYEEDGSIKYTTCWKRGDFISDEYKSCNGIPKPENK